MKFWENVGVPGGFGKILRDVDIPAHLPNAWCTLQEAQYAALWKHMKICLKSVKKLKGLGGVHLSLFIFCTLQGALQEAQ